jgi:hypothetical protein
MARKVPASPAHAEVALDAALAQAPRPTLPPGLTARIVAQATALPQIPADDTVVLEEAAPRVSAKVLPFQPVPAVPVAAQQSGKPRRFALAGGFAAIAATVAAVLLLGQPGQQVSPGSAPAPVMAQRQNVPVPVPQAAPLTAPETRLASAPAGSVRQSASPQAAPSAVAPEAAPAVSPSAPADTQLAATVAPAQRESAGPTSDPSPRPNPRGLMGPPAPQQGWAFGGGVPGSGTMPGGQGLPSQTTGSAPPPPPPPGH